MKVPIQRFFSGKISRTSDWDINFTDRSHFLTYIADFYCHELHLAIEVDGKCHDSIAAKLYDARRQSRLENFGVRFLRFDDARMKGDINKVVEEIRSWIEGNAHGESG